MPPQFVKSLRRAPEAEHLEFATAIPFTSTPFVEGYESKDGEEETALEKLERIAPTPRTESEFPESQPANPQSEAPLERVERPRVPEWLGIFFDLAWTTTFSNLTKNTALTTSTTVFAYGVFFILAWWLWAAQVTYDTKFYTNDWYSRIVLLLQLVIFGTLAAFTKDFDPFQLDNSRLADDADFATEEYQRKCMLGISGLFAASRLILVISYLRLAYYMPRVAPPSALGLSRRESELRLSRALERRSDFEHLLIMAGAFLASALIFLCAFILVKLDLHMSAVVGKLILWGIGIALEVIVFFCVRYPDPRRLLNEDTLTERLGTLTTIILGEGLNSLAETTVLAASAVGFGTLPAVQTGCSSIIIAFSFALYFEGFRRRPPVSPASAKLNLLMHWPLHLALILALEGCKNMLIVAGVQGSLQTFLDFLNKNQPIQAFRNVGINITDQLASFNDAPIAGFSSVDLDNEFINKVAAQALLQILTTFELAEGETADAFNNYINSNHTIALRDNISLDNSTLIEIARKPIAEELDAAPWIPLAAGGFLLMLALLSVHTPRHRYVWGSTISRAVLGGLLASISLFAYSSTIWPFFTRHFLLLPIVAGTYLLQFVIDQLLVTQTVRHIENRGGGGGYGGGGGGSWTRVASEEK